MLLLWKGNQWCMGMLGEITKGRFPELSCCLGSPAVMAVHDCFSWIMFDVYSKPRVTWSRVTLTERVELCLKDQICAPIFGPLMFLGCGCAHRMFFSSSFDGCKRYRNWFARNLWIWSGPCTYLGWKMPEDVGLCASQQESTHVVLPSRTGPRGGGWKKKQQKKRVFESVSQYRKRPEAERMFCDRRVYLLFSMSATSVALQSY